MHCKKCGLEIDDETYFCPECGSTIDRTKIHVKSKSEPTKSNDTSSDKSNDAPKENQTKEQCINNIVPPQKNPGIAVILALVIGVGLLGTGHMYAGKIKEGISYLILGIVIDTVFLLFLYYHDMKLSNLGVELIIFFLLCVCGFSLYVWQIYDAYDVTKEYNNTILKTGKAPW